MATIGIFGIGNILFSDDGVGPSVVAHLVAGYDFPEEVIVEDMGTPDLSLVSRLLGYDAAIFIDAVTDDGPPGTVRRYDRDAILRNPPGLRISPHDPSMQETLMTWDLIGEGPKEIVLIGIVAGSTEGGSRLTENVRKAIPAAAEAALAELERLGAPAEARRGPSRPHVWWEEGIAV